MTQIEELQKIRELLVKYSLPVSPILDYSIQEKIAQLESISGRANMVENAPSFEIYKDIEDYIKEFSGMSVGISKGKKLPHKAILLLSIMEQIESGLLSENVISLDNSTAHTFSACWQKYRGDEKIPSVWIPFWYLKSESFWHFQPNIGQEGILNGLLKFAGHPSVGQMRPVIQYAYFDSTLFDFITTNKYRELLKNALIDTYLC